MSTPLSSTPSRKPWLAALASLVLPGFGQFYNGELNRAIWIFLCFTLLTIPGVALIALYLPDGWMLPALVLGLMLAVGLWGFSILDAWRRARANPLRPRQAWQTSGAYALVFLLCDLLALPMLSQYVRQHQVEPLRIPSASMEPSVQHGDLIWADKRYNCPGCKQGVHRGDIALFAYPNDRSQLYIKRVIGLPGDHIQLKDQRFRVNGQALQLSAPNAQGYITEGFADRRWQVQWRAAQGEHSPRPDLNRVSLVPATELDLIVPDGQVFVAGDNRAVSLDSRSFGSVPLQDIVGRARQVWYSASEQGVRWGRLGRVLQ